MGGAPSGPRRGAPESLGLLRFLAERPGESAVLTDFDGTLAPIVADPADAEPLPEATAVLRLLASRFAVVAVVSGRPASFLAQRLAAAGPAVQLFGVYGTEWVEGGVVRRAPEVEPWRAAAAEVVTAARAEFTGGGVGVEDKGASVTLHWRRAPEADERVRAFALEWARRTGLVLQPGRMAIDFRPPAGADKGVVVERLARGCAAACFVGDDVGDLAAFAALDRLAGEGTHGVRVAVSDAESPAELLSAADIVVDGPAEALALLGDLARAAGG